MRATYRVIQALAVAGFLLATGAEAAASQDAGANLTVSRDERAIYEAVLDSWLGSKHGRQSVNQRLGPPPSASEYTECAKGVHFAEKPTDAPKEKVLDASTFRQANIELVDGETWRPTDPGQGIRQGKSVDAAVDEAVSRSLITFSQITFSADGADALVNFSMTCGRLCGTGFTLRMHRSRGQWRSARRCGGYIS
jgi:hypothetical protein